MIREVKYPLFPPPPAATIVAAATAASAAISATAAGSGFFFLSNGNRDRTTFDFLVIKAGHCLFTFFFRRHFDKSKTASPAADLVHHYFSRTYLAEFFAK